MSLGRGDTKIPMASQSSDRRILGMERPEQSPGATGLAAAAVALQGMF